MYMITTTFKIVSPSCDGAPAHWGLGEIDGMLMPPGKASYLLTDHLISGKPLTVFCDRSPICMWSGRRQIFLLTQLK